MVYWSPMLFMYNSLPPSKEQRKERKFIVNEEINRNGIRFLSMCLQHEIANRITCDKLLSHPFLSNDEMTADKKEWECDFIEPKNLKVILQSVQYKLLKDIAYRCFCGISEDVVLACDHSFCLKCLAKMRYIENFKFKEPYDVKMTMARIKHPSSIIIECPKCLAYGAVSKLRIGFDYLISDTIMNLPFLNERYTDSLALVSNNESEISDWLGKLAVYGESSVHFKSKKDIMNVTKLAAITIDRLWTEILIPIDTIEIKHIKLNAEMLSNLLNSGITESLLKLDLEDNFISDEGVRTIIRKVLNERVLKSLNLYSNGITLEGMKNIAEILTTNFTLKSLNLGRNWLCVDSMIALAAAVRESAVTELAIQNCYLNEVSIKQLAEGATRLITLDVSQCFLGKSGIHALEYLFKYNKTLCALNLSACAVPSEGIEFLAAYLKENCLLCELFLSSNAMGLSGIEPLMEAMKENKALRRLHLDRNSFDYRAVAIGEMLARNDTLMELNLLKCKLDQKVTDAIMEGLKKNKGLVAISLDTYCLEPRKSLSDFFKQKESNPKS
eukprot:TRINITY_DN6819_c0_g3_i2.p1 TRINITY_DN6819_c0_g3~~TRINITY_DN6819_c0_g3_i2.p1  ORF type:complete len:556 (+),score=55.35 TRINITY_DN6819_c0_g3_i2:597-2264(+)